MFDRGHQLRQRDPRGAVYRLRVAAEIADGLEVHTPHGRGQADGQLQQAPDLVGIHSGDQRGHQHDPDAVAGAGIDRAAFHVRQSPSTQFQVHRVVNAVELQEDAGKAGVLEGLHVSGVGCQPNAVGVQLNEAEADLAAGGNDFRQVIPHGGFTAGELNVAAGGHAQCPLVPVADFLQAGIDRVPRMRPGKAHGAVQVAAAGHLQQHGAGALPVLTA